MASPLFDLLNNPVVNEIISTIFRIYLSKLTIYQRFLKYIYQNLQYINDSTRNIDLPTKIDIPS
ncbi:hypothetical protein COD10_11940 [Bacillus thuringiensis]|uniref:Uncharacterized protein n=4 Tax=Bacillus thuringiensis TaxID=1428 RepID=A0AB35PJU0_BACTU|nr:hypothetical protein BTG_19250 [Bacillus thuringiensis HD-771]AFQ29709.1 hypothetical protein BTF1_27745 [Bacillus thuringiensis HD-789]AJH08494.1 hypothetical protein AS86_3574 [Bacillus thuringiensis HD1002]AJQ57094.1 hypothetical protein SD98_01815 [Bacillus thuringiensis serovar morrisoni]AND22412.1 hypothetical protein ATN07_02040 [Bacillus thuringiensis serovar israelensis]KAA0787036.1 hypothetical protein DN406_24035 [Bacillus sp. BB56-3]KAA0828193.1 hypothetical protein DN403_09665